MTAYLFNLIKPVYAATPVPLNGEYGFGPVNTMSDLFMRLRDPILGIASLAIFIYLVAGAYKFLTSGGDKTAVEDARNMITHAIIGVILLILMFVILKLVPQIFEISTRIIL